MSIKFTYFDIPVYGEGIRYMLHYGGLKFEDVRVQISEWPIKEIKDTLPYGQLPLYEEGNKTLNQSLAIARYVASKTNLLPSDPWQQAVLDAAVFNVYDYWGKVKATGYFTATDAAEKAAIKKEFLSETVPFYFTRFEKDLKAGNGYFGGKLTWADFILVAIIESNDLFFGESVEKNYPTVMALVKEIQTLPGVKEYIATRKPYTV